MAKKTQKKLVKKTKVKAKAKKSLKLGSKVPSFEAPATGGKLIRLSDLKGQKLVLFFYPKDMTPGCTVEGHEFTQLKKEFEQNGTVVFGVSRDSMISHERFKEKECYTIDLLSDENEKLCKIFGVIKEKNMYGRKVLGIERSTFVINPDGKLVKEWRGVSVPNHAKEVLDYIKTI